MDFKVDVRVKTHGKDEIDQLEQQIEKLKNETINVDVQLNSKSFQQSVNNITKQANNIGKQIGSSIANGTTKQTANVGKQIGSNITKSIDKIQRDFRNGKYDAKASTFAARLAPYENQINNQLIQRAKNQEQIYNYVGSMLNRHFDPSDSFTLNGNTLDKYLDLHSDSEQRLNNLITQIRNTQSKTLKAGVAERGALNIEAYMKANTRAMKRYGVELQDLAKRYRSATTEAEKFNIESEFKDYQTRIKAEGLTGKSFLSELGRGFKQIGQFAYTYGAIERIPEVLTKMSQEVIKVDDAMTQMMMATGINKTQAQDLMSTYSEMGKELKATGVDVATSATEWLKQGKSIEEANTLARDSIILSKIGDLSAEESTSTITAAMKSYDLDETGVMNFIDQISAIDMASATDVGGLATAFNEVAANARNAGVEIDTVLAYAATIGETTQEGMASVGTSLNAIFSRMGNIKLSRLKDPESGEDLSNVETSLRNVGIKLRESTGEFRDFDDVLDETASRWDSFSEVTQRSIASSFAGTHHMNEFLVLMQNYDKALEYMDTAQNASGQSLDKYEAYQESLNGRLEDFNNSFQTLSTTVLNSDFFGGLVDGGTAALDVITQLVDAFGTLNTIAGGLGIVQGIKGGG